MARILKGMRGLQAQLKRDAKRRSKRVRKAIKNTAQKGARVVRRNVPVAFSELRDSVHADRGRIVADAPHAAAVEVGSRPHTPPLDPLIRWVKLRKLQSGVSKSSRARLPGTTTGGAIVEGDAEARGIAFLIQRKISREGTKPTHFMFGSLPAVERILDSEIKRGLR